MDPTLGHTAQLTNDMTDIARRPLLPENCALVVVDIQEKLLPPIFQRERLLKNCQLLIRTANLLNVPAILTTQYAKALGNTVPEIASLLPDTQPFDKQMFSCFGSEAFCASLKRLPGHRNTMLLCG